VTGKPLEATIVIEDLQTGSTIFNASSNSVTGTYTTVLQPGHDYGISIKAPGYVFHSARYTIPANVAYDKLGHDFQLQKLAEGEKFVANNIFFDYNTATLSPESRPELDRIVEMMTDHPQLKLEVDGHTDNIGSATYNDQLSLARAESVRDYLVAVGGIAVERIKTQGFGYHKPIASNSTEAGRKQNRRSEFTILSL
jgi:outer membrane protein OmpA-like peptidoglycan-associated protein